MSSRSSSPASPACSSPPSHYVSFGKKRGRNRRRRAAEAECEKEKRDEAMREGSIHATITASSGAITRDAKGMRRKTRRARSKGSIKKHIHSKKSTGRRH